MERYREEFKLRLVAYATSGSEPTLDECAGFIIRQVKEFGGDLDEFVALAEQILGQLLPSVSSTKQ
jgi:hypothetical protein